ncbi:hypothetical protein PROFUN_15337 [Planoprotostelium fungivorum]|uniref:C2H2-type domain-containing protein n=1 Tax=Planoprotostelium fungivorum TaxID=1890364 RepID=A0A2P6MWY8_9EUKA|nr:hypothetical protein PROFUN_15337 [Planoprotostelium fungivorum]
MFDTSDLIFNIVVTVDSAQVLDYSGLVDEFNISEEDSPSDVFKFDDDLLQESQIGEDVEIQGVDDISASEDGKRDWVCPFPGCGASYVAKQSLNKHWDKKHPGQEIPQQFRTKKRKLQEITLTKRKKPSLRQVLRVFDKSQLVDIICNIAKLPVHIPSKPQPTTNTPNNSSSNTCRPGTPLCDMIFSMLPEPDLTHNEREMESILTQMWKSFPHPPYGTNRDNFAFKRVQPHLAHFKSVVIGQLKNMSSSQNWTATLDFLVVACKKTHGLPIWDDVNNNKMRIDLWNTLLKTYQELVCRADNIEPHKWETATVELSQYPEMNGTAQETPPFLIPDK